MLKSLLFAASLIIIQSNINSQCNLDFGSSSGQFNFTSLSGQDLVNGESSGINEFNTQSFDIWDESNNNCSVPGGLDDITFEFEILHAFDQYGVDGIIDQFAGETHEITQKASGLRGMIPAGRSGTNDSSTADVRGYRIKVSFASHVEIYASDVILNLTGINTAGEAHESTSIIFLDENCLPYGNSSYEGFYQGSNGASTNGSCSAPSVRSKSWTESGNGVYTASSTSKTAISSDPCNPIGGSNGFVDFTNVSPVWDSGLSESDRIGGFEMIVYLEDVAASEAMGAETSTNTLFTSTLNGMQISASALPVELSHFTASSNDNQNVNINWTTQNEINTDYFEVLWSENGRDFSTVDIADAAGFSNSRMDYNFTHSDASQGENYYQLKSVDLDGSYSLSNKRVINLKKENTIQIYQTTESNIIHINNIQSNHAPFIFNQNGQLIREIENTGFSIINEDISALQNGIYFISANSDNTIFTKKIIKLQ